MRARRTPEIQHIAASRVIEWLLSGWRMFLAAPGIWVIQTLIFIALNLVAGVLMLPLSPLIIPAAFPVFCAGMLFGAARIERGVRLEITHIFAGFRQNTGNLMVLGVGYLMGGGVVLLLSLLIGGSGALLGYLFGTIGAYFGGLLMAGLVFYGLWILLLMALWFAPALVMMGGVAPMEALMLSARACMRNLPAFAVLGVMLYVLISLAMMPAGLGVLVLMPVIAGAVYASYRDVFGQTGEAALIEHARREGQDQDAR